jgi:hypothetical protein
MRTPMVGIDRIYLSTRWLGANLRSLDPIIGNPMKSSSTTVDSPQYDGSGQGRHPLNPSSEYPTPKALLDREGSASNILDKLAHSTDASLSPASTSSSRRMGNYPSIEAPIPHHGRYSPMNLVDQSRDNMRHGLDLGTSGEKLGLNFLLDGSQGITNVPSGHSKSASHTPLSSALGHLGKVPVAKNEAISTYITLTTKSRSAGYP